MSPKIKKIIEFDEVSIYLSKRALVKPYKKVKDQLLHGNLTSSCFKLRKPKKEQRYQFRINKQFRAHCFFKEDELIVFKIDNHQ